VKPQPREISVRHQPNSKPSQAYDLALTAPLSLVICDYTIKELHKVFHDKFPDREGTLTHFLQGIRSDVELVSTPDHPVNELESTIRDPKDWPILRAALASHADGIVTGDKDLLDAELPYPSVLTPAQFLDLFQPQA